jgi:hypothetical protein
MANDASGSFYFTFHYSTLPAVVLLSSHFEGYSCRLIILVMCSFRPIVVFGFHDLKCTKKYKNTIHIDHFISGAERESTSLAVVDVGDHLSDFTLRSPHISQID